MKNPSRLLAGLACVPLMFAPAFAQDELSSEPFDINNITCWDVVTLADDDASFVTAMLIGYTNGKAGAAEMSAKGIFDKVAALDKACADNPDMMAIDALH